MNRETARTTSSHPQCLFLVIETSFSPLWVRALVLFRSNKKGNTHSTRGQQSNRESSVDGEMPARHRIAGLNFEFRTVAPLKPQTTPSRPYHDPSSDVKRLCGVVAPI